MEYMVDCKLSGQNEYCPNDDEKLQHSNEQQMARYQE